MLTQLQSAIPINEVVGWSVVKEEYGDQGRDQFKTLPKVLDTLGLHQWF